MEPSQENSAPGSSASIRWAATWKDADATIDLHPKHKRIKARLVAGVFEDPAQSSGRPLNTARMALRKPNQIITRVGAAESWTLRKIDISTAFLKSDPIARRIRPIPTMGANLRADETWVAKATTG